MHLADAQEVYPVQRICRTCFSLHSTPALVSTPTAGEVQAQLTPLRRELLMFSLPPIQPFSFSLLPEMTDKHPTWEQSVHQRRAKIACLLEHLSKATRCFVQCSRSLTAAAFAAFAVSSLESMIFVVAIR
jgi:hypothetical protein